MNKRAAYCHLAQLNFIEYFNVYIKLIKLINI